MNRRAGLMRYEARHFIDSVYSWAGSLLTQAAEAETAAAKSALESPVVAERALACKRAVEAMRETHAKKWRDKYDNWSTVFDIPEDLLDDE